MMVSRRRIFSLERGSFCFNDDEEEDFQLGVGLFTLLWRQGGGFLSRRGALYVMMCRYLTISAHSSFLDFHINIATSLFEDDNLSKVHFAQVKNAKEPFEYKRSSVKRTLLQIKSTKDQRIGEMLSLS